MTEEKAVVKNQSVIEFGQVTAGALIPRNFEGLYRMSEIMAASGLMPKGIESPAAVFVAVQMGMEIGLSPMQAVQNIAVINGRPSMWGDAVLGLVRASGLLEEFDEQFSAAGGEQLTATCTAKRKGQSKSIVRSFSMADAKQAELDKKPGPWKQYPKRMLQMRARSWALRDGFGDVLKGLRVAEEVMDYDMELTQQDGTYQAETQGEAEMPEDVTEPFESLSKDIAGPELDAFVKSTAAGSKTNESEIKAQAVEHWDRFQKAFKKYQAKQAKTEKPEPPNGPKHEPYEPPQEKPEPKPGEPKPSILCKAQKKGVFPTECAECQDRIKDGCDSYTEWEFEENLKQS